MLSAIIQSNSQDLGLERIDPPNWWVGMNERRLQLLVHGNGIATSDISFDFEGVQLKETTKLESPNYLFLNLHISKDAKPGSFEITFTSGKKSVSYNYELKARHSNSLQYQGLNSGDVIYFLMPDRFANGDVNNDDIPGMREKHNREFSGGRHGGGPARSY